MKKLIEDLNLMVNKSQKNQMLLLPPTLSLEPEAYDEINQFIEGSACASLSNAPSTLGDLDNVPQYAFGIILFGLDHLDKENALILISRLKTLHCKHLILATRQGYWQKTDFYGLGMSHLNHYEPDIDMYEFNLHSYKSVPDWLNNKFWANPKMWDKYRW